MPATANKAPAQGATNGNGQPEEAPAASLAEALLAVQLDLPTAIQKDAENPHFKSKYVTFEGLLEKVRPVLNKHGIVLSQYPTFIEGNEPVLITRLLHVPSGESEERPMLLLAQKRDPQGQGSAITYAKRYSLMAMLGVAADEDDDGNKAAGSGEAKAEPKLTSEQAEKAAIVAKDAGITDEALSHKLRSFGVKALTDLTYEQGFALKTWIEERAKAGEQS